MKVCTFFGHSTVSEDIYGRLLSEIEKLIINEKVDTFYIGNQGAFDALSKKAVCKSSEKYSHINYNIVLAYRPANSKNDKSYDFSHTILPEEVAVSHPKYSIAKRNNWMATHSDFILAYVTRDIGGAAKAVAFCRKRNKKIINIAEMPYTRL